MKKSANSVWMGSKSKDTYDDRDVEIKGKHFEKKAIDFVITGGIAAIESPKIIRELRRYGANVRVFMTANATEFVSARTFEWASKNPVVTELTGSAQHITRADLVIVAPATLDFISKISLGLADSAAATLVQSAIARIPVFFAPAMHLSLTGNPAFSKNLEALRKIPLVSILSSLEGEGKAKMMKREEMIARISHFIHKTSKKAIISLGPTRSYADDIRFLSNISTGALGLRIAQEFFRRGIETYLVAGPVQVQIPSYLNPVFVNTREEMQVEFERLLSKVQPEIAIFSAAVLDFEIDQIRSGKTSSSENWSLQLKPAPKLIDSIRGDSLIKVGFKLESGISSKDLKQKVEDWVKKTPCDFLIANRLEDLPNAQNPERHLASIFSFATKEVIEAKGKAEIAQILTDLIFKTEF